MVAMNEVMKIGIMPKDKYIKRTIAIAKGEYKPSSSEPKVWFESMLSMAQVLSSENQELLKIIKEEHPESISDLEELTKRKKSNLSRTLSTLERYGIVRLEQHAGTKKKPVVLADRFEVSFAI